MSKKVDLTQSLTKKILAELESGMVVEDGFRQSRFDVKKAMQKKSAGSNSLGESKEQRLRRVINFGNGFYSIAEAGKISGIGEAFIRKWVSEGKLSLLGYPDGKRRYVSGIELSEVVIQYNLNPEMNVTQRRPSFVWRSK